MSGSTYVKDSVMAFSGLVVAFILMIMPSTSIYSLAQSGLIPDSGPRKSLVFRTYQNLTHNNSCTVLSGEESHAIGTAAAPAWPWQILKSTPLNPPELELDTNGEPLHSGLLFLSPSDTRSQESIKKPAALIMTDTGQLVWNGPIARAVNFKTTPYEGKAILTYWTGVTTAGANVDHDYGNVTFLDSSYNEILVVYRDTLLVTAYNVTNADLSSLGGSKNGWVNDCLFFELDPRSGKIIFSWSALEHVPVSDTKQPLNGVGNNQSVPFDWFHINSVVNIGDNFLVNSRHVWTTYLVAPPGKIIWTLLGEDGGDFGPLPVNGQFAWQHFAMPHNITNDSISIPFFNNYNSGVSNGSHPSNLLELRLPLRPDNTTTPIALEARSVIDDPIYAVSQGSYTFLSNGNAFGGYGQVPIMREFGSDDSFGGDLRWSARFGPHNLIQSYRAYKQEWHGYPTTIPSLVVESNEDGCNAGHVSWNGATDVSGWMVSQGPGRDHLTPAGEIGYKGFETKFKFSEPCVQATAVVNGQYTPSNIVCSEA